jgi:hypothetical protein
MTVHELPDDIRNAASLEEAAARLGALLGLDHPVPLPAARRALADAPFARALLTSRKLAAIRDQMLAAPETVRIAPSSEPRARAPFSAPSPSARILAKAAGTVLKWGMAGLSHAEPWVIERRLAACNGCEFQADAPDTLLYRGVQVVVGKDARICTRCRCLTNTKAALATEHCPERDPANPELSRWGAPWVDPETLSGWPWR